MNHSKAGHRSRTMKPTLQDICIATGLSWSEGVEGRSKIGARDSSSRGVQRMQPDRLPRLHLCLPLFRFCLLWWDQISGVPSAYHTRKTIFALSPCLLSSFPPFLLSLSSSTTLGTGEALSICCFTLHPLVRGTSVYFSFSRPHFLSRSLSLLSLSFFL